MTLEDLTHALNAELTDPEFVQIYLNDALEEDGIPAFLLALRRVVKASGGLADVSETTGLGLNSLYKTLSAQGNPEFATLVKILDALGYRIAIVPKTESALQEEQKATAEAAA